VIPVKTDHRRQQNTIVGEDYVSNSGEVPANSKLILKVLRHWSGPSRRGFVSIIYNKGFNKEGVPTNCSERKSLPCIRLEDEVRCVVIRGSVHA
jgi:hypothetical protein